MNIQSENWKYHISS